MRILILADSNSPHTMKWAKSISEQNISVCIFSIHRPDQNLYTEYPNIQLHSLNIDREVQFKGEADHSKLSYLKAIKVIRLIINDFKPDILHSHYASSYGLLGALVKFHPFIISVWGSDVFSFPKRSFMHKLMLKYVFFSCDTILSTSENMKLETQQFTKKNIQVTPFGIDTNLFRPIKNLHLFREDDLVIGTIKSLEKNYGIEYLVKSFKILKDKYPLANLKLLLVGQGSEEKHLKSLVHSLGIKEDTVFTGYVPHSEIQNYHNILDIYVAVSLEESFGVSVLEASACMKPVVVSNVGGLPEVVQNGRTGFIVEKKNIESLVDALEKLFLNQNLRLSFGENGREMVKTRFNWSDCISQMISIYESISDFRKK